MLKFAPEVRAQHLRQLARACLHVVELTVDGQGVFVAERMLGLPTEQVIGIVGPPEELALYVHSLWVELPRFFRAHAPEVLATRCACAACGTPSADTSDVAP